VDAALGLFKSIGGALLALVVIAVLGWVAISRIRAWMKAPEDTDEGFTLSDLRRLHREGSLSDEEFERAHAQIIAAVHRKPSKKEQILRKHPPTASPVDHRLPAARSGGVPDERPTPPDAESRQRPIARAGDDGRIVIRDESGQDASDAPPPPSRPKRPTDPRTDSDRG
jgi:hypothetical protein